ncbi:MAG: hypothetical protein D6811_11965 [Alphaproteobacteria bacterium]|nr:MAG: hypothetical protein D6811_11965 [Alphaproteobacteria bacterium]
MTFSSQAPAIPGWRAPTRRSAPARGSVTFRLGLFNLAALALVGAAFGQGWVQQVFLADSTGLTWAILAVFLAGIGVSLTAALRLAAERDTLEGGRRRPESWVAAHREATRGRCAGSRSIAAGALRARVGAALQPLRHLAGSLVLLGLIGTVLGFIMALSGVGAGIATDVGQVGEMVTRLIEGMSVALYTTLEGSVLSLWLTVNHQILSAAASGLVLELVAEGEAHARD